MCSRALHIDLLNKTLVVEGALADTDSERCSYVPPFLLAVIFAIIKIYS